MENCHHLWFAQELFDFNITKYHPACSSPLSPPLAQHPRRQPSVSTVAADAWPENSFPSPYSLEPQQEGLPYLPLTHLILHHHGPALKAHKLPEQQQNRWRHLSFQLDFYCYYGTIRSHSTSLYLITAINLKSLLFDVSTEVIPMAEPCQALSTNPCQSCFPQFHGNELPGHFCQKLQVKASRQVSAGLRVP